MGVIDVTKIVDVAPSGHPSFNSIASHADSVTYDFAAALT